MVRVSLGLGSELGFGLVVNMFGVMVMVELTLPKTLTLTLDS